MRRAWMILLLAAGCSQATYVVVTVDSPAALDGVSALSVDLTLGARAAHKNVQPKSGVTFPTTFAVEITSGSGSLGVHVDAVDSGGKILSSGEGSVDVSAHHTVSLAITLGGANGDLAGSADSGEPTDGGAHTDGGPAVLTAAPDHIDLNPTAAAASHTRDVVITNGGGVATGSLVTNLSGTGVAAVAFGLNGCDGKTLAPGDSCTTQVTITPPTPGSYTAQLSVHDGQGNDVEVPLSATAVTGVQLTLSKAGNGAGDVTGVDLDCGSTCSMLYPPGTVVTLTETPEMSTNFTSWSVAGCSGTTCDVTVNADTTVTATFTLKPVQVTVTVSGTAGSVSSTPAGISNCTSTCMGTFYYGQTLTLTATPSATGYVSAWSQGCAGGNCAIMPTADTSVGVTFAAQTHNFVFITSTTVDPGAIGGIAGATTICNTAAANGGLGGSYVPWLSSTTVDAGGATGALSMSGKRGWVRRDGQPFVDTLANLIALKMYYPLTLDESGNPASDEYDHKPLTFTNPNGTKFSTTLSDSCQDWTSTTNGGLNGNGYVGDVGAGGTYWTDSSSFNCKNPVTLICFGVNSSSAVTVPTRPAGARLMFPLNTSTDTWDPGGTGSVIDSTTTATTPGIGGADSLCQSVATRAGLATPTHFYAYLAPSDTAGPWTRFTATGGTWYRPDNVQLFANASDFLGAMPTPQAPFDVFADGTYANGYLPFTIGSTTSGGNAAERCGNWDTDSSSNYAPSGQALETYDAFQYGSYICGPYMGLLCVQQ